MNPRTKTLLLLGAGAVGVFALGWYLTNTTSSSASSAPQNAVNPNAQIGGAFPAMGTLPDIGNLLSYNQPVGATMSAPQATSVSTGQFDILAPPYQYATGDKSSNPPQYASSTGPGYGILT